MSNIYGFITGARSPPRLSRPCNSPVLTTRTNLSQVQHNWIVAGEGLVGPGLRHWWRNPKPRCRFFAITSTYMINMTHVHCVRNIVVICSRMFLSSVSAWHCLFFVSAYGQAVGREISPKQKVLSQLLHFHPSPWTLPSCERHEGELYIKRIKTNETQPVARNRVNCRQQRKNNKRQPVARTTNRHRVACR